MNLYLKKYTPSEHERHGSVRDQKGFTLMEVLVSLVIATITALSLAYASTTHLSLNTLSEQESLAISAAQQVLDDIRSENISTLPTSGSEVSNVEIGGRTFEVKVFFCQDRTYCTSNDVRALHCEVALLKGQTKKVLYAVDTVFAQLH